MSGVVRQGTGGPPVERLAGSPLLLCPAWMTGHPSLLTPLLFMGGGGVHERWGSSFFWLFLERRKKKIEYDYDESYETRGQERDRTKDECPIGKCSASTYWVTIRFFKAPLYYFKRSSVCLIVFFFFSFHFFFFFFFFFRRYHQVKRD